MAQPGNNVPPSYDEATKPGASFTVPPPQQQQRMFAQQPPLPQPAHQGYMTQPLGAQTVLVQPGGQTVYVAQPNVILVHPIKQAPCFDPYTEVCQYCNVSVVTRRRFVGGGMTCMFLILALFFFPFIFFICCDTFKDSHHYCPRCQRLIAIKRR